MLVFNFLQCFASCCALINTTYVMSDECWEWGCSVVYRLFDGMGRQRDMAVDMVFGARPALTWDPRHLHTVHDLFSRLRVRSPMRSHESEG